MQPGTQQRQDRRWLFNLGKKLRRVEELPDKRLHAGATLKLHRTKGEIPGGWISSQQNGV